ncbi:MAG: hypothetical protein QOC71_173, partial [Thermoplasmata archaeon]|nr:hypothetical protein [Thermoplasmata archaeon]
MRKSTVRLVPFLVAFALLAGCFG